MKIRETKERIQEAINLVAEHFGGCETGAKFVKQARSILDNQHGVAYSLLDDKIHILIFWWGTTKGPIFTLVRAGQTNTSESDWLREAIRELGHWFTFQTRGSDDPMSVVHQIEAPSAALKPDKEEGKVSP